MSVASPDFLKVDKGGGVRRLNRVPLGIALGVGTVVLSVLGYTVMERSRPPKRIKGAEPEIVTPADGKAEELLRAAPTSGVVEPRGAAAPLAATTPTLPPVREIDPAALHDAETRRQEAERKRQARETAAEKALQAETGISVGSSIARGSASRSTAGTALDPTLDGLNQQVQALATRKVPVPPGMPNGDSGGGESEPNLQKEKKAFLGEGQKGRRDWDLDARLEAPRSPYLVRSGAVIPAVLIGGINSDLPGQLLAQVCQNVWDTATGRYLLIPQGSRLVGTYDSQISAGQERVLVAWQRIVWPDASALELGMMPGADASGYAGFNDEVNNHYFRVFGHAILLSLFSAGVQLSQPQAQAGQNYSPQSIIAANLGQQLGQLGMELARKNLQVQPTLEIRPGYRLVVQVTKDLMLTPWEG